MMRKFSTALLLGLSVTMLSADANAQTVVSKAAWDKTPSGQPVDVYMLGDKDLTVKIITYGARVQSIEVPDRHGVKRDVVLGFNDLAGYEAARSTYIGAIVGRYGNRIAKGTFKIGDTAYHVPPNDHGNALHGGTVGFDQKVWDAHTVAKGVELTLVSPDGDMGFPGMLTVHVRYTLEGDSLYIAYTATTTKPTVVNLTNHSYFNLAGDGSGNILNEVMQIHADSYTPVDAELIPTGEIAPLAGTPLDFREPTAIGARIHDANEQLKLAGGYDHNYIFPVDTGKNGLHMAVQVYEPESGRMLTVMTTEPGVQFYSGNLLEGVPTSAFREPYVKYAGFCLETQHFPDSPNEPGFPSTVLLPGQTMHTTTILTFGTKPSL
jgi:aldose 1-epimerase